MRPEVGTEGAGDSAKLFLGDLEKI